MILFAGCLFLAGCSEVDWAYDKVTDAVHSALYEPRHVTPGHPSHATATTPSGNYNVSSAAKAPVGPVQPELASTAKPVVVDGLSATAVRSLLGQPAARGGPAPGETWTYKSGSCEVKLFLFPNVNHGGMQVLDHRVSGAGTGDNAGQACLRRLRDGQNS